jgi:lysine 2,3-aminomutase
MPTFVVDGLGGLGKLPIIPSYVKEVVTEGGVKTVLCRNYKNETVEMPFLA